MRSCKKGIPHQNKGINVLAYQGIHTVLVDVCRIVVVWLPCNYPFLTIFWNGRTLSIDVLCEILSTVPTIASSLIISSSSSKWGLRFKPPSVHHHATMLLVLQSLHGIARDIAVPCTEALASINLYWKPSKLIFHISCVVMCHADFLYPLN